MYHFWTSIIKPLLEKLQPKTIVEIGSDRGENTRQLLAYCQQYGAKLHVIDLAPKYNVATWEQEYGETVNFHLSLSLNAIPLLKQFDVVLIDGDHNWYTVFNELKLIEKRSIEQGQPFPVVMLHDIGWPYGRRDLYYNPETIPIAYRQPYQQKGMRPGLPELAEAGGLNSHLHNSIYEHDWRNGVLTAVEDFLQETEQAIDLIQIPGLHGLGILVPVLVREQNPQLAELFLTFQLPSEVKGLIEQIESDRLVAEIASKEYQITSNQIEVSCKQEVEQLKVQIAELRQQQAAELQQAEATYQDEVVQLREQTIDLQQQLQKTEIEHEAKLQQIEITSRGEAQQLQVKIAEFQQQVAKLQQLEVASQDKVNLLYQKSDLLTKKVELPSIDIVVCVHNALDDVLICLESINNNTLTKYNLYIVDDGSDEMTAEHLRQFSLNHPSCTLLVNPTAEGYTKAANKGLQASTADYVILLNSDAIVPKLWTNKLLECAESDSKIGIVGPLSNAASWQSVPEILDVKGNWATNLLPPDYSVDDFAEVVASVSEKQFPLVPFVNGFCFVIKRRLITTIGYFDEEAFPRGYGEENDYCLRAINAGFKLAIADHLYVYHAKSKSYGLNNRNVLAKAGNKALRKKYDEQYINKQLQELQNNQALERIRQKIKHCFVQDNLNKVGRREFSVLFLLPVSGRNGGINSIIQEVIGMRKLGIYAQIAAKQEHQLTFHQDYPLIKDKSLVFYFYEEEQNLISYASQFQVVVATIFNSVQILKKIVEAHHFIMPAYYVQDYEPWFWKKNSKNWDLAYNSYTLVPGTVLFAKTQWLREIVEQNHPVKVEKVDPSLDQEIYYPNFSSYDECGQVQLVAMVRPSTPRRAADKTMKVLKKLKQQFYDRIGIHIFGCTDQDIKTHRLESDFDFVNHGILIREEVARLLNKVDIFLDLSDYQAFGRTGLEAMACGCAVILPAKGGANEYATNRQNALLIDTSSENSCYKATTDLIVDSDLRHKIAENAVMKATEYSIHKSAISELTVLRKKWFAWSNERDCLRESLVNQKLKTQYQDTKSKFERSEVQYVQGSETQQQEIEKFKTQSEQLMTVQTEFQPVVTSEKFCPICSKSVKHFKPFGEKQRPNARCPVCNSLERHRLVWLYFQEKTNLFKDPVKMLHFAPEKCIMERLLKTSNIEYVSADLNSPLATEKVDIQNIKFADNSFDVIYCSHVLEHVPDDKKAMRELHRVLKPNGWAVIMVPVRSSSKETLEDPNIKSPEERLKYYGQSDHLRYYGLDFKDRLKEAGFRVKVEEYVKSFDLASREKYNLPKKDYIYFCIK